MDHDQVKFNQNGKTIYGIVDEFAKEAEAAASRGNVIVEDAILPKRYEVPESALIDIEFGFDPDDEYRQYVREQQERAQEQSDRIDGLGVGRLFHVGVGDGYASYVVLKVNKKTVKIEWRGFSMDRWVDQRFGYGGTFPRDMVEIYCRNLRFSKKT